MQNMNNEIKFKARKTCFILSVVTSVLSTLVCFHILVGDMSKGNIDCL